ncbi:MAG: NAD(P)/FAD-dependent oxidoreductase [Candidatus Kariarchaeaceae archaeon]|jgi:geranylgeranyl reductase family protein
MENSSPVSHFDYDVIVVGGGPAGVLCAITVAKSGFTVVIVDKKKRDQIGDKTCGDAIDKAAVLRIQKEIGLELPMGKEISDPIETMSIAATNIEHKISLIAPGYVVDRLEYGQRLLGEAEKIGVKIIDSATVRGVLTENMSGEKYLQGITYLKNGEKTELRAKFTIDASGAYAAIRKRLPEEMLHDGLCRELNDDELWPTYREVIELHDDIPDHTFHNEIILLYRDDFPPPGYFWIFTKGRKRLNCGIGWMKNQSEELGSVKQAYLKEMKSYYDPGSYKIIKSGGGQIPVRPPFDSLVVNGGAVAGDAACMVHPVTAEGHGPALDTGMRLGMVINQALVSNDRSKRALWGYNIAVSQHYGLKHTQALIMRSFLVQLGVKNLQFLIDRQIFKEEELNLIFAGGKLELSTMDKIKRVSKLFRKPRILLMLRKIFVLVKTSSQIYTNYPSNPSGLPAWREERNRKLNMHY